MTNRVDEAMSAPFVIFISGGKLKSDADEVIRSIIGPAVDVPERYNGESDEEYEKRVRATPPL